MQKKFFKNKFSMPIKKCECYFSGSLWCLKANNHYSVQYLNGGTYPVPMTAMVLLAEVLKFIATLVRSKGILNYS